MFKKILPAAVFLAALFFVVSSLFINIGAPGFSLEKPSGSGISVLDAEGCLIQFGSTRGFPLAFYAPGPGLGGGGFGAFEREIGRQCPVSVGHGVFLLSNFLVDLLIWFGVSLLLILGVKKLLVPAFRD